MDEAKIRELIREKYNLNIKEIEKIKNIYKVSAEEGIYCIKVIRYEYEHFKFILQAILHLQQRGFTNIPKILETKSGEKYIDFLGYYAYLTEWIPSRESNFDDLEDLAKVSEKLAILHKYSEGFTLTKDMKPRIAWFSWINVFNTRKNEILDFKNRISQKAYKSNFDLMYLSCMDEEIERAERCINLLKESNYISLMEKEVLKRGFCHHDYANHNILINPSNKLYIIDFDYCILDTHLHDVASLLIRAMKNDRWEFEKADCIINNYSKVSKLTKEELRLIKYFLIFPQAYWQLGIQKYWEQQPWKEELFLIRLSKYIEDREERELFIEDYFS